MAAGFNQLTDLYEIYHCVQNTMIRYTKDLLVASLREYFSQDSKYNFSTDSWGFPEVKDHTDLPPDAGLFDDLVTRVFIGESYNFKVIFYPAILIKSGSWKYVPISLNRDQYNLKYDTVEFYDNNGNRKFVNIPASFELSGAWEGSLSIEVQSRGIRERDDLVELISIYLVDFNWNNLSRAGVSIKPNGFSISGPSEADDRNDKLHKQSINIDVRTEWHRSIPITDTIDIINFCVEFGDVAGTSMAENLQVNTKVELEDQIFTDEDV